MKYSQGECKEALGESAFGLQYDTILLHFIQNVKNL